MDVSGIPVDFDDWEGVLKAEVEPALQRRYREAIVKFRYWLRETGKSPVQNVFKEHLDWKKSYLSADRFAIRREALRWYYLTGLKRMRATGRIGAHDKPVPAASKKKLKEQNGYRVYEINDLPTAGAKDLGDSPWEQALVRRLREKKMAWKSEQTYRNWCRRFMADCGSARSRNWIIRMFDAGFLIWR